MSARRTGIGGPTERCNGASVRERELSACKLCAEQRRKKCREIKSGCSTGKKSYYVLQWSDATFSQTEWEINDTLTFGAIQRMIKWLLLRQASFVCSSITHLLIHLLSAHARFTPPPAGECDPADGSMRIQSTGNETLMRQKIHKKRFISPFFPTRLQCACGANENSGTVTNFRCFSFFCLRRWKFSGRFSQTFELFHFRSYVASSMHRNFLGSSIIDLNVRGVAWLAHKDYNNIRAECMHTHTPQWLFPFRVNRSWGWMSAVASTATSRRQYFDLKAGIVTTYKMFDTFASHRFIRFVSHIRAMVVSPCLSLFVRVSRDFFFLFFVFLLWI